MIGLILTVGGLGLFAYFIYIEGIHDIAANIEKFGWIGFGVILGLYSLRIISRLGMEAVGKRAICSESKGDTIPAVIIGEALKHAHSARYSNYRDHKSCCGSKTRSARRRIVICCDENLFYSLITSIFLILGAVTFLENFQFRSDLGMHPGRLDRHHHRGSCADRRDGHPTVAFCSTTCEWLYDHGWLQRYLEHGRLHVRLFENLIYGFYRKYPRRFLPICGFESVFHLLGVGRGIFYPRLFVSNIGPTWLGSFLLESVSRLILVVFKLIPFLVGVDEAGARFVTEVLGIGTGVGITLAIIRKGRVLFWTAVGLLLSKTGPLAKRDHRDPRKDPSQRRPRIIDRLRQFAWLMWKLDNFAYECPNLVFAKSKDLGELFNVRRSSSGHRTGEPDAVIETPEDPDEVHYQAVEKEGVVTAIWEMRGRKHLRTIDPRRARANRSLAFRNSGLEFQRSKRHECSRCSIRGHSCFCFRRQEMSDLMIDRPNVALSIELATARTPIPAEVMNTAVGL